MGQGPFDRDLFGRDPGIGAGRDPDVGEIRGVGRGRNKQTAGIFNCLRDDPPQDDVLRGAVAGRAWVRQNIASSGVEQTVVAPRRALAEVALLDQNHFQATQAGIPGDTKSGSASTDDEKLGGYSGSVHIHSMEMQSV